MSTATPPSAEPAFQVLSFQPQGGQDGGYVLQTKQYQKRKTHRKSKGGCIGCKVRRVKCDEGKPSCGRCRRNKADCNYDSEETRPDVTQVTHVTQPTKAEAGLLSHKLEVSVFKPSISPQNDPEFTPLPYGTSQAALLRHFQHMFPEMQNIGSEDAGPVISLGISRPYLLDTILAVSASHLRHHATSPASYRVAEHFRQGQAISKFQGALGKTMDQKTADAMLFTSILLGLLSFSLLDDDDPYTSWVFSDDPNRLGWFSINMGLKVVIRATCGYQRDSMLKWMFQPADPEKLKSQEKTKSLEEVPPSWLALCGLTVESGPDGPFSEPLLTLAEIKDIEPAPESKFIYMAAFNKLGAKFRMMLEQNDERAMWVLGYWLGLVSRYDKCWWTHTRTLRDWKAIRIWFNMRNVRSRPDAEGKMWNELMDDLEAVGEWVGMPDTKA